MTVRAGPIGLCATVGAKPMGATSIIGTPARTFVVHGEAQTACDFADLLAKRFGWSVEAPAPGTRVDL